MSPKKIEEVERYELVLYFMGQPTGVKVSLPGVTHIIRTAMKGSAGGMGYWGYKLGIGSQHPKEAVDWDGGFNTAAELAPKVEARYKRALGSRFAPHAQKESAGSRGTDAHGVLDGLAKGEWEVYVRGDDWYITSSSTPLEGYELAGARWWVFEHLEKKWETVASELKVMSLPHGYGGTLDLLRKNGLNHEIVDYKTHKPVVDDGPSYPDDRVQNSGYEQCLWDTVKHQGFDHRIVLLAADGTYLEDDRWTDPEVFLAAKRIHDEICPDHRGRRG